MKQHNAKALWKGSLKEGSGEVETGRGHLKTGYSYASRFGDDTRATSPEELIGAAHAGCFSMFLSMLLEKHGHKPKHIQSEAQVTLSKDDRGPFISKIELQVEAAVEEIEETDFQKHVQEAKANCPISRALASIPEITVTATLSGNE